MIFSDHPSPKKLSDHSNTALARLFVDHIKEMYGIEKDFIELLGHFLRREYTRRASNTLSLYASSGNENLERLEQTFLLIDTPIASSHGPMLMGLLKEGKDITEEESSGSLITDLRIYKVVSTFNAYKLVCYAHLLAIAEKMELGEVVQKLRQNQEEESLWTDKIKASQAQLTY